MGGAVVMFTCDGCGKQAPGAATPWGTIKPDAWWNVNLNGDSASMHACTLQCIDKIIDNMKATAVSAVAP